MTGWNSVLLGGFQSNCIWGEEGFGGIERRNIEMDRRDRRWCSWVAGRERGTDRRINVKARGGAGVSKQIYFLFYREWEKQEHVSRLRGN